MANRDRSRSLRKVGTGKAGTTRSASCSSRVVELTVQEALPTNCTNADCVIVFVHGLDSWRGTWAAVSKDLALRGLRSLSVDLRGHGEAPLGDADEFGPKQLAADVRAAVVRAGFLKPEMRIVLIGHSMGGRIAMRYAAEYPEDLAAVIIEDMDCAAREYKPRTEEDLQRRKAFVREFKSWKECYSALTSFGYDEKRIDGWRNEMPPRVFEKGKTCVWSAINPHAQQLAMQTVLASDDGLQALTRIAAHLKKLGTGRGNFAMHVLVAGPKHTVCKWDALPGGVHDMGAIVPGLKSLEFAKADHSIHNSNLTEFADYVESVLSKLAN